MTQNRSQYLSDEKDRATILAHPEGDRSHASWEENGRREVSPAETRQPGSLKPLDRKWEGNGLFHLTMGCIALLFIVVSISGMYLTNLAISFGQILPRAALLAVLLAGAVFYRWRRLPRAVNLIAMTFWAVLFSFLHLIPMFVAARMRVELCDAFLAKIDARMGIEVPDVLKVMGQLPRLHHFLGVCYDTLIFLVTLAIMVPPMCGKMRVAKEYAIATLVAAMISIPLFAFCQAVGPWVVYQYPPDADQEIYVKTLLTLKSSDWFMLDFSYRYGLITFPSFHTVLAVLTALALWSIPYVRWPAAGLAGLIVISTVTTGWHYIADVVGGVILALGAYAAAKGYTWLEARISSRESVRKGDRTLLHAS